MTGKVVGLRGEPILQPGEVNPEVVALAEELLDLARAGEINTLLAVFIHADEGVGSRQRGVANYRLVGMLTKIMHDICAALE